VYVALSAQREGHRLVAAGRRSRVPALHRLGTCRAGIAHKRAPRCCRATAPPNGTILRGTLSRTAGSRARLRDRLLVMLLPSGAVLIGREPLDLLLATSRIAPLKNVT
jgi:hypothetical protein